MMSQILSSSKSTQPSNRQLRVGELIRRSLSEILVKGHLYDPDIETTTITVSEVRCSADLKIAKVYVMPLGGNNINQIIEGLEKNRGKLRQLLGKAISTKYIPDLRFFEDKSFDQMDNTRRLLNLPEVRKDIKTN